MKKFLIVLLISLCSCSLPLLGGNRYVDMQKELKREFALSDTKFYQSTLTDPEVISQLVAVQCRLQLHLKVINEFMEVIDYDNPEEVAILDIMLMDANKLSLYFTLLLEEAIAAEVNKSEEMKEDPNAESVPENNEWHPYRPYVEEFGI